MENQAWPRLLRPPYLCPLSPSTALGPEQQELGQQWDIPRPHGRLRTDLVGEDEGGPGPGYAADELQQGRDARNAGSGSLTPVGALECPHL